MRTFIIFIVGVFLFAACTSTNKLTTETINHIELIQVDHPYLGGKVDSFKLDNKYVADFLVDFADKKEEVLKFYSCYVIKIHLKDGSFISYRTNGQAFEKFKDDNTKSVYFSLNKDTNLVTKYWGIPPEKFCETKQITSGDIKGNWYLNKWTMYHTLAFSDTTVFLDNHIDSVFSLHYAFFNDSLILWDTNAIRYAEKVIAITNDTLVVKNFNDDGDTLRYSRLKRGWKN